MVPMSTAATTAMAMIRIDRDCDTVLTNLATTHADLQTSYGNHRLLSSSLAVKNYARNATFALSLFKV